MKRLYIVSGLIFCFSTLPAFAQRGGGMHRGRMHGPGLSMGGPRSGMDGMRGSWGQMSPGGGARINGAGRASKNGPSWDGGGGERKTTGQRQGTPASNRKDEQSHGQAGRGRR